MNLFKGIPSSVMIAAALLCLAAANAFGQTAMRIAGRDLPAGSFAKLITRPVWAVGFVLCGFCGIVWSYLITRVPLVVALPIFNGLVIALAAVFSHFMLGETLTTKQLAGIVLVVSGIALLVK